MHHGACIGADCDAVVIAYLKCPKIIAWPGPYKTSLESVLKSTARHGIRPFRARNQCIVDRVQTLYAFPDEKPMHRKSGTAMTVNMARKNGIWITLIWPDGTTTTETTSQPVISFR
jgi:hypothetical protein